MDSHDFFIGMLLMLALGGGIGYTAGTLRSMNKYIPEIVQARSEIARLKALLRLGAAGERNE